MTDPQVPPSPPSPPSPPIDPTGDLPSPVKRRRFLALRVLIPVALVVVALAAGGVYMAINPPRQCGVFGAARHGLLCEAPLPDGVVYQRDATALGIHDWIVTVASTSYERLHDFFAKALSADGWKCILDLSDDGTLLRTTLVIPLGIFGGIQSTSSLSITFVYGTLTVASPQPSPASLASMLILYGG